MGGKYAELHIRNAKNTLILLLIYIPFPHGITAEAKAKPKLEVKKKTVTAGKTYRLKFNGASDRTKVKWRTSNKSVVLIAMRKGNAVTFKSRKKGTAVVTAFYKQKKYKCWITVKEGKKNKLTADNPVLNSSDVTLYHLSESYKDYIKYYSSHLREYRFRVSGTKKEVRGWRINGEDARYFKKRKLEIVHFLIGGKFILTKLC